MADERNTLKCIFARSFDDLILRNKLRQLCATYLGGIWTTVPSQQIRIATQKRLSPRLLGIFPGGRFEEYIPSRPLTNDEYCKACVAQEVGRILARIHSLDMPISKECRLAQFVDDMIENLRSSDRWKTKSYPMHTTLAKIDKSLCPDLITIDLLAEELEICKKCLAQSGSPLVFSNNDLHEIYFYVMVSKLLIKV
uniref:Uncharacterized protein n=1 Tax=Wuchereria bancrofti TaxID=6293 RepID=A0AAF5PSC1_WUCBA